MTTLDWSKPIQFENGEPCELIETAPDGTGNFPDRTRIVHRIGVEGMPALWWFKEDGKSNWPGYNIVNVRPGGDPTES